MVKSVITAILLCIYALGATEAYQLCKIPLLIKHYQQHKTHNPKTGIMAFLKEHYADKTIVDDDFLQDMQLPFKTHQADISHTVFSTVPQPLQLHIAPYVATIKPVYMTCHHLPRPFFHIRSIFQPPQA